MVYCQKCGASNTDDARFCNMCGTPIAQAGEPGGLLPDDAAPAQTLRGHESPVEGEAPADAPVDPVGKTAVAPPRPSARPAPEKERERFSDTPPPMGLDVSTVSLAAIGVRSRGKAWAVIVGVALVFVGLGAVGMWVALNMNEEPPSEETADATDPTEPTEVDVADPVAPEGAEPPPEAFDPPEGPTPTTRRGTTTRRSTSTSGRSSATSGGGGGGTGSTGSGSTGSGSTGSGSTGSGSTGSGSTGSGGTGSGSTGSGSTGSGSTGSGSTGSGSTGSGTEPDWDSMEEQQADERDLEMDLYTGRLRQFIQTYYMRRAGSCFDMASRNNPELRGRVTIGFTILADGTTQNTRVVSNETGLDSLAGCLSTQVAHWRLPAPPEGEAPLEMSMPFRGSGM
ncbi:MAG: AgmX/PglI C-terminal domain-containing protein [Sandaracinaceae bacterium]